MKAVIWCDATGPKYMVAYGPFAEALQGKVAPLTPEQSAELDRMMWPR